MANLLSASRVAAGARNARGSTSQPDTTSERIPEPTVPPRASGCLLPHFAKTDLAAVEKPFDPRQYSRYLMYLARLIMAGR
jgi:hypothetical protein